ncbi:hypothetical protein MHT86_03115 [Corynebacterium mastitidis]|uniref:Uncharacterized protein n=1 Tax=Corynebacterium mastitidis TaxID=161890 RepID=A0A2N0X5Y0_9CORY|nr:hypothetical protein [Corynebacterium mastitidis]MCH6196487.1 hypothetical protein [Corynebacterium mastitidis]PKF68100.1 hypothetical protein CXB45_08745 [Corynebacterium mastitidis]
MLIPIPGYGHLKIYLTDAAHPSPEPARPTAPPPTPRLRARVLVLLEVLCARRPLRQLSAAAFEAPVLAYARAHRRARRSVRLCSLHLRGRQGTEIYGSCEIGGARYGFTGCVRGGKIAEFRVLW